MNFIEKILILGFPGSFKMTQMEFVYKDFDYTIIEAVDGKKLKGIGDKVPRRSPGCRINTDEFYMFFSDYDGNNYKCNFSMIAPELACCLSHIKICQYIIDNNLKNVLVLEDDAFPTMGLLSLPEPNMNYDFINFQTNQKSSPIQYLPKHQDLTVAYFVKNSRSAKKYIDVFNNGYYCADTPFSNIALGLNMYCTSNSIFYHDTSFSIINQNV
jgi:hypothetical protein